MANVKTDKENQALKDFAGVIKTRRKNLNLNQEELAERSGLSTNAIKLIETEKQGPRLDTIVLLAKGLGCRPWELLADGTAPTAEPISAQSIAAYIQGLEAKVGQMAKADQAVVDAYAKLDDKDRDIIRGHILRMAGVVAAKKSTPSVS